MRREIADRMRAARRAHRERIVARWERRLTVEAPAGGYHPTQEEAALNARRRAAHPACACPMCMGEKASRKFNRAREARSYGSEV